MSLEAALTENTAAMRELIAALTAAGALQTAQASAAAQSSPAVQAVVRAQKDADAKKPDTAKIAPAASAQSGAPSASTPTKSSAALHEWHEKTASTYAELKDAEPTLENARKAILAINSKIGRVQADAVLGRFGVQAVSPKADKKGLDESQYPGFLELCLEVLAGRVDATLAIEEPA
jgi:hypothetical protein